MNVHLCNIIWATEFNSYKKWDCTFIFWKTVNIFILGFDAEIELSFPVGSSEGLKYERMDWLSLVVYMRYFDTGKYEGSVLVI